MASLPLLQDMVPLRSDRRNNIAAHFETTSHLLLNSRFGMNQFFYKSDRKCNGMTYIKLCIILTPNGNDIHQAMYIDSE